MLLVVAIMAVLVLKLIKVFWFLAAAAAGGAG